MAASEQTSITKRTVGELLGRRLNDIEMKYAPHTLYVRGSIPVPLSKPKVSIVGSRKASLNGLSDAVRSQKNLLKKTS